MKARGSTVLQDFESQDAWAIASCGQDNDVVRRETGNCSRTGEPLTDGQIGYRLKKAKEVQGFKKGDGPRRAYRQGRNRASLLMRRAAMAQLRKDYQHNVIAQIEKPEPKIIRTQRFERRERAKADRYVRSHARLHAAA